MIFLELVLQNFGPYYGRQVINFSPEHNGRTHPIILVGGMNGGGKTTLMDAIRLAFYGQRAQCSTRGNLSYGDFLSQCVNRHAKGTEETIIELAFEHVLNNVPVIFHLKRTWWKNPKNGKDILNVSVDQWLDDALTKTWDERIEDILPLGISNLFLFDGEQVKELAELDTPPPQVTAAIESLLGLELAEKLGVDLEILVNRKRKEIASTKQLANLEELETKIKDLQKAKKAAKKELAILQEKLQQAHRKQQESFDKYIAEGGKIAAESAQLKSQLKSLEEVIGQERQQLRTFAANYLPLALIQPLLTQAQAQGETELKLQQAQIAQNLLLEREEKLLDYLQEISLANKHVAKIKSFLEQENNTLQQKIHSGEKPWLKADSETINQLSSLLKHQLPEQIRLVTENLAKLQQLATEIDSTEIQLQIAAPPETYQELEQDWRDAQEELSQSQTNYELGKRQYEALEIELQKTKKQLERYGEQNIDLSNDEHIIKSASKVQATLKLFREKLTLRKLNKLEIEVAECFRYLLHKPDLVHRLTIDSKTYSLSLYDAHGQSVPKQRLSAGEKQLLAIALLWGLARVSGRQLPVAIDTPLGRLDSDHRHNLVERYFPSASHQVILLSTDTEIAQTEVKMLQKQDAIARQYLLQYDSGNSKTMIRPGYFW